MSPDSSTPNADWAPAGAPLRDEGGRFIARQAVAPEGADSHQGDHDQPLARSEKKHERSQARLRKQRAKAQAKLNERGTKARAKLQRHQAKVQDKLDRQQAEAPIGGDGQPAPQDETRAQALAKLQRRQLKAQDKLDRLRVQAQAKLDRQQAKLDRQQTAAPAARQTAAPAAPAARQGAAPGAGQQAPAAPTAAGQAFDSEERGARAERRRQRAGPKKGQFRAQEPREQQASRPAAEKQPAAQAGQAAKGAARAEKKAAAQARQAHKQEAAQTGQAAKGAARAEKKAAAQTGQAAGQAEKGGRRASRLDKRRQDGGVPDARQEARTPRQQRAEAQAFARRRQRAEVGIEVDGQVVRVVEIDNGEVIWARVYGPATSAADSIRQWLDERPGKRRRWSSPTVAWACPGTHLRMIEVPEQAQQELRQLIFGLVKDDVPMRPGSYMLAAAEEHRTLLEDSSELGEFRVMFRALAVTAVDQQPLGELWQVLLDSDADLVPSEYMLGNDGLVLALRNSKCSLALCRDGVPVVARDLPVGGVDALSEQFSGPDGRARFEALLRGERPETPSAPVPAAPVSDPWSDPDEALSDWDTPAGPAGSADALVAAADAFVSEIASEVRASVGYWLSQGHSVPSDVQVFGPGAQMLGLAEQLDLVGLRTSPARLQEGTDWGAAPTASQAVFHGAATAALREVSLVLEIENPLKQQEVARESAARVRTRRLAVAGVLIVAAGWFLLRPFLDARAELDDATFQRDQLSATVARMSAVEGQVRQLSRASASVVALTAPEPDWANVLDALRSVKPADGEFLSLELGLRPCAAGSVGESGGGEAAEGGAAEAVSATVDAVACIGARMTVDLPEAESAPQRLTSMAGWVSQMEAIGGAEVWPQVELGSGDGDQAEEGAAAPEPEPPADAAAAATGAVGLEPDPASLANSDRLRVVVDLLLPSSGPYRTPRGTGAAAESGDEQNG